MPVLADPDRPDGRVLLDSADREIGRFEARRGDGRPLADIFTLAPGVTVADAAAVVLADLRGWRVCCREPLARRLIMAGGRPGRHSHAMSRDLLENPAPAAWLERQDVDGFRLTSVDRPARDLTAACAAAFPPDHPDYRHIPAPADPENELDEIMSGRLMGPLLPCSGLAVADDGTVAGAILVNRSEGDPPFGGPWISQLFRHPDARGCGAALLRRALGLATRDRLPALGLAVTHGNRAIGLYAGHGFVDEFEAVNVDL